MSEMNPNGPKAYYLIEIAIHDFERYREYPKGVEPLIERYGGRYLVRGGEATSLEGAEPGGRIIVLEFPNMQAAQDFANCDEYPAVAKHRLASSASRILLVEGI
ncbi:DUF1330 domain-containing protein [Novosphingobium sp. ZN18A2]|uniref:DUF1330 domain-containing protein n=1 Tax=Novosphingobium sp. ZN18A2 TaxID=3079861 RepID=UPI0030D4CF69